MPKIKPPDPYDFEGLGKSLTLAVSPITAALVRASQAMEDFQRDFLHIVASAYSQLDWDELNKTHHRLRMSFAERRRGESLVEWGKRLEANGDMDNPDIRWMYQKEVLQTVFVNWWKRW